MNAPFHPVSTLFDNFTRLQGQIDIEVMRRAKVLLFGAGAVASVLPDLAALQLGKLTIFDNDTVSGSNVLTGNFRAVDIGCPKPVAIAQTVQTTNPACEVVTYLLRDDEIPPDRAESLWEEATLVLSMTDDPLAQIRLNRQSIRFRRDMVTAATGATNRMWEIHANLFPEIDHGSGCLRCFAHERFEKYEAGRQRAAFYPSHRLSAGWLNLAILYVTVGLLHYRAGSNLPIAAYGRAFAQAPYLFGLIDLGLADEDHPVFGDLATGRTMFATRQMARPRRVRWLCPDCGTGDPG